MIPTSLLPLQLLHDFSHIVRILKIVEHQTIQCVHPQVFLTHLRLIKHIITQDIIGAMLQRSDLSHDPRSVLPFAVAFLQPFANNLFRIAIVVGCVQIVDSQLHGPIQYLKCLFL